MSTITASPASAAPQGTMPGSLDSATLDRVDALAAQMGRSRDWVLNEAITSYLDYNEWFVARVREGLAAAERGEFASPEEVDALFRGFGAR